MSGLKVAKLPAGFTVKRLGTTYGGWEFIEHPALIGSTIMSCGLGEDGSFDVEFASNYQATIIIVDPTPRAILHFQEIQKRCGLAKSSSFSVTGKQPVDAYDLEHIKPSQLKLIDKAAWIQTEELKFYSPPNPDDVSHSVINYQNQYTDSTPFIVVEAQPLATLIKAHIPQGTPILKLDIEGAEIEVIEHLMSSGVQPQQILVEYDELAHPSWTAYKRIARTDKLLRQSGYQCYSWSRPSNFLYARSDSWLSTKRG